MNTPANNIKGRPVIGTFMTYIHNTGKHKGELVEVDFKVTGRKIEYKYTSLKKRNA